MSQGDCKVSLEELKVLAQAYYSDNGPAKGVLEKMGDILNTMFYNKPTDIYGHLVIY